MPRSWEASISIWRLSLLDFLVELVAQGIDVRPLKLWPAPATRSGASRGKALALEDPLQTETAVWILGQEAQALNKFLLELKDWDPGRTLYAFRLTRVRAELRRARSFREGQT